MEFHSFIAKSAFLYFFFLDNVPTKSEPIIERGYVYYLGKSES